MAGLPIWRQVLSGITNTCRDIKTDFSIQTNLWNLTDDLCRLFKEFNVSIGTSLDGPEEINDNQRGKGYFRNTMRGLRMAEKYDLKPGCICTFTPDTVSKYRDIFNFFVSNRLSFSIHGSLQAINAGKSRYNLSPEDLGQLLCNVLDLYVKYRHYIKISTLDQMIRSLTEQEGQVCTFKDCFGMFLAVDPDGYIYPCQRFCGDTAFSMGNILSEPSLEDLSTGDIARRFICRQEAVKSQCSACEYFNCCRGGCTYNAWAAGSDIDPYCTAYKMIFDKIKTGLLNEMKSEDNLKAVTEKPFSGRSGNPLLRKGALTELTRMDTHPVKIAENAIRIISYVELAANPSIEKAVEALTLKGIRVTDSHFLNIKNNLVRTNGILNNLYIHLTFKCQLSCNHCYATAEKANNLFMPVSDIIRMVKEAHEMKFRQVVFTGGEPLLHPGMDDLLEQLIGLKTKVSPMHLVLRSNFVRSLSQDDLIKLAAAFTKIIVSIDGDREYHDKRRGPGTYDAATKNLEKYQSVCRSVPNAARLSLSSVFSNEDQINDLAHSANELARKLDIRMVRFRPVLPIGRAEKWDKAPVSEAINSFMDAEELIIRGINPANSCGLGQNLYIEPDGNAFPCYAYQKPHSCLGNVIEYGLRKILDSEEFRDLQKHTVDTNKKCQTCKYRYICGGACRAWGGEGTRYDLDAAPPECSGLYKRSEEIYHKAIDYLQSILLC